MLATRMLPHTPTTSPCCERHRRPLQRTDDSYNPHYVYRDSRRARHCFGGHHWRRVYHCTDRLSSRLPQLPTGPHITSGPRNSTKRAVEKQYLFSSFQSAWSHDIVGFCRPHVAVDMALFRMKLSTVSSSSTLLFLYKSYLTIKILL